MRLRRACGTLDKPDKHRTMEKILVNTLMTGDVSCVAPETRLCDAAKEMAEKHYSCIVVKQNNSPIGIVTERDLVKVLCSHNPSQELLRPVSDFMSSPVHSLNQNESLFDALVVNRSQKVRHIPVVNDDDELIGIVTQSDLANAHFQITEIQSQRIEEAVISKTHTLRAINEELQTLSMEDHLMGIGNRRAMEVDLEHTHSSALRYNQIYSLLLLDVDYFKLYNDCYGHQKGDEALKDIADIIKNQIRASDRLYRYGGEELLLLLPSTNAEEADIVAKKLVCAVQNQAIPHRQSPFEYLTMSSGCTSACKNADEKYRHWQEIVEVADKALYQAKDDGRNRVVTIIPE